MRPDNPRMGSIRPDAPRSALTEAETSCAGNSRPRRREGPKYRPQQALRARPDNRRRSRPDGRMVKPDRAGAHEQPEDLHWGCGCVRSLAYY